MRIIAITGATGGLAKEIVKQLPSDDFVIALGRNVKKLEACYVERPNTVCYELDMSSDEAIGAMVEKLYAEHGYIDVFINNADCVSKIICLFCNKICCDWFFKCSTFGIS